MKEITINDVLYKKSRRKVNKDILDYLAYKNYEEEIPQKYSVLDPVNGGHNQYFCIHFKKGTKHQILKFSNSDFLGRIY
jgi:hypothetical protein